MKLFSTEVNMITEDIIATKVGKVDGDIVVYPVLVDNYRMFFESKYTTEKVKSINIINLLEDNSFYWVVEYDKREPLCPNPMCFTDGYGTAFQLNKKDKDMLHSLVNSTMSQLVLA